MAISGVQLIYRLVETARLLIDQRPANVEGFIIKHSINSGGPFVQFDTFDNIGSETPSIRGKILYEIIPSTIPLWDNDKRNYIKIAEVIGGVPQPDEGPLTIPTRLEMIPWAEKMISYGFNKDGQKFIPISVNEDGEIITA